MYFEVGASVGAAVGSFVGVPEGEIVGLRGEFVGSSVQSILHLVGEGDGILLPYADKTAFLDTFKCKEEVVTVKDTLTPGDCGKSHRFTSNIVLYAFWEVWDSHFVRGEFLYFSGLKYNKRISWLTLVTMSPLDASDASEHVAEPIHPVFKQGGL